MLFDFVEPVCRACCNYEGIDKIKEVIENAKAVKSKFEVTGLPNGKLKQQPHSPLQPEPQPIRSPHEQLVSFLPAAATTMSMSRATAPSIATMPRQQAPPPQATYMIASGARPDMSKVHVVSPCRDIATTKQHPGFPLPGALPPQTAFTHMHRVGVAVPASHAASIPTSLLQNLHHGHKPLHLTGPEHANPMSHDGTTQRFAQIQDTLNTLSKSPPFRVRFSKDHSLIGRVIAFDAVCRGSDFELKVFIEYPIGSQTVFQSASGAGRQMYGEFRERLGIGGGFRGASSNGYKDLEFERLNGEEDWRVLGELLTEEVRFFRGSVKKDLLPTPFLDPKFPNLPPATLNATRGFLKNNLLNQRKRVSSSEENGEGEARKERKTDGNTTSDEEGRHSHSPKSPRSPSSGQSSPNLINGCSYAPTHSPCTNGSSSPTSSTGHLHKDSGSPVCSLPNGEANSPTGTQSRMSPPLPAPDTSLAPPSVMQCLICRRTLDDSRYVQCPSTPAHKFCFCCTQDSIKKQMEKSSDVYCPSGLKCLVVGSNSTPWAFMEHEISQILHPDTNEDQ